MNEIKQASFKFTGGINQDNDPQSMPTDAAYRLFNIKMQNLNGSTMFALVNEKGNSLIPITYTDDEKITPPLKTEIIKDEYTGEEQEVITYFEGIRGEVLGTIECGTDKAVLFTYEFDNNAVLIYRIIRLIYNYEKQSIEAKTLFYGDLGIVTPAEDQESKESFIQRATEKLKSVHISGLFCYENSSIQKIYWTDGENQLRYLNISESNPLLQGEESYITDVNLLNSNPSFRIDHKIQVTRIDGGGKFQSGVIQWAFTYFNKYGAETGIVDITPLYYISKFNRGGKADEIIGCSYKISITNPDTSFDYLRLYSIQRTSLNGTPIVKIVGDYKLKNTD